jgi:hypothetical protein
MFAENPEIISQANKLTVYRVPNGNSNAGYTSIASNHYGDIMVIFRDALSGVKYYYKVGGTNTWTGPTAIPGQTGGGGGHGDRDFTFVRSNSKGDFYAVWCIRRQSFRGHWAKFDRASKRWTNDRQFTNIDIEWPRLAINPKNDDVLFYWVMDAGGKDAFFNVLNPKTNTFRFSSSKDISNVGIPSQASGADIYGSFDEHGNFYATWRKKTAANPTKRLGITIYDSNYTQNQTGIMGDQLNDNGGDQFLACVSVAEGQGLVTYLKRTRAYQAVPISISNYNNANRKILNINKNAEFNFADAPALHYHYHHHAHMHGDELAIVYKDSGLRLKLIKYKYSKGRWAQTLAPTDVNNNMQCNFVIDMDTEASVGILCAWHLPVNNDSAEQKVSYFSVYQDPKRNAEVPVVYDVESAIVSSVNRVAESSFFSSVFFNQFSWQNNPKNNEHKLTIVSYKIYRKHQSESKEHYVLLATVNTSTTSYQDNLTINSAAENDFVYYVTCVDDENRESKIE